MAALGIVSNCQLYGLAEAAARLLPEHEIRQVGVGSLLSKQGRRDALDLLKDADHVFVLPLPPAFAEFGVVQLPQSLPNASLLPALFFIGLHPDLTYLPVHNPHIASPTGDYHSIITLAGFLSGRTAAETIRLFNPLVYARLGYLDAYGNDLPNLIASYQQFGIDFATILPRWMADGGFLYSPNHPKPFVLNEIMSAALKSVGLPIVANPALDQVADTLHFHPRFPIYPEIAARIGLAGSLDFMPGCVPGGDPEATLVPLERFVEGSYAAYAGAPLSVLSGATGVQRALQAGLA